MTLGNTGPIMIVPVPQLNVPYKKLKVATKCGDEILIEVREGLAVMFTY